MDEKIINSIKNNDSAELNKHLLEEIGLDSVICDALHVIGITTLEDLVNYGNIQQLTTVVDALPAENRATFYSVCKKENIGINDEIKNDSCGEQSEEKTKILNHEMLYEYISEITNNGSIAWIKAIKGTEKSIAMGFLKSIFKKYPSIDEVKSLRCFYSTLSGTDFNDYCLNAFGELGLNTKFQHSSLIIIYVNINYKMMSSADEFIVYQLYDENNQNEPFKGLFAINQEDGFSDYRKIKNNYNFYSNLVNNVETNRLILVQNIIRLKSFIAMYRHYLYILEKSNLKSDEATKTKSKIQSLLQLNSKITTQLSESDSNVYLQLLKEIESTLKRHITETDDIDELDFSVRTYNCLKRAGINTIAELCSKKECDLIKVRNLGRRSLQEVLAVLYIHGFKIIDNPESPTEYKFSSNIVAFANLKCHILAEDGSLIYAYNSNNGSTDDSAELESVEKDTGAQGITNDLEKKTKELNAREAVLEIREKELLEREEKLKKLEFELHNKLTEL